MIRKFVLTLMGISLFALASCQVSDKKKIARKWEIVKIINPAEDSFLVQQELFIDTLTTVDSFMAEQVGTNDIDTIKIRLREEIDAYRQRRDEAFKNSFMEFKADGVLNMYSDGKLVDSNTHWSVDKEVVYFTVQAPENSQTPPNANDTLKFNIAHLSTDSLSLKMKQNEVEAVWILRAAKEESKKEK